MENYDKNLSSILDNLFEGIGLRPSPRLADAVAKAIVEFGRLEYDKGLEEGKWLATQFCQQCGSCGEPECCPATRCNYFHLYDKTMGDQFKEALARADRLRQRLDQLLGLGLKEQALLMRWRGQHVKCVERPKIDTRCQLCKATDKRLAEIDNIVGG